MRDTVETINRFDERAKIVSEPYKTIIFSKSNNLGLIILLASFFDRSIGFCGLVSFFICNYLSDLTGVSKDDPLRKIVQYNCILTGFAAGYMLWFSIASLFAVPAMAVTAFFITRQVGRLIEKKGTSSIFLLNIPFTLTTSLYYFIIFHIMDLSQITHRLAERHQYDFLPDFADGFARNFGLFVFLPYDFVGSVILCCVLLATPVAFIHAAGSYYLGVFLLSAFRGIVSPDYLYIMNINFILAGLFLHWYIKHFSAKKYIIMVFAIVVCALLNDAVYAIWTASKIPLFTLPYIFSVLLALLLFKRNGEEKSRLSGEFK